MTEHDQPTRVTEAAVEAYRHGLVPIPLRARSKAPGVTAWTQIAYTDAEDVRTRFTDWTAQGLTNLGVALGGPSGGLVDVDLDHPSTVALKRHFLPPTTMRSGRPGRPLSHYWYRVDPASVMQPGTRRYKMPDGAVSVELRSTRSQTAVPPSVHPRGEDYTWVGPAWGGTQGPAVVDGQKLAVQVALLGLGAVLIENWPRQGSRHEAYLALAGGLLRLGRDGVHPWWETNLPVLITALADCTHDEDGGGTRVAEVMDTTLGRLRSGEGHVSGWPTLAGIIGDEHVQAARRMAREVESLAGFEREAHDPEMAEAVDGDLRAADDGGAPPDPDGENGPESDDQGANQADDALGSWVPVDWEPFLAGERPKPMPALLTRTDGLGMIYERRLNLLYGRGGSAKSWIATYACLQEMAKGERVLYLDLEDDAELMFDRLQRMGVGDDDLRLQFAYINPEDTLSSMMQNRYGEKNGTPTARRRETEFLAWVKVFDPTLIVIDAMAGLAQMHGLDTNQEAPVEAVGRWAAALMKVTRATVLLIDHGVKKAEPLSGPAGSDRKRNMTRGTMLHAWTDTEPVEGGVGRIELLVTKDTPGQVKKEARRTGSHTALVGALVVLDSTVEGSTQITVGPPAGPSADPRKAVADFRDAPAAARAAKHAEQREVITAAFDGMGDDHALSGPDIRLRTGLGEKTARARLGEMVEAGVLVVTGTTRDRRYVLVVSDADD